VQQISSAQLKIAWGVKRLETLCWEALTYQHSHAYMPRIERDVRSPKEVKYEVFAIERQAPSDDWPLMAGGGRSILPSRARTHRLRA
jgi:hypothetical protein